MSCCGGGSYKAYQAGRRRMLQRRFVNGKRRVPVAPKQPEPISTEEVKPDERPSSDKPADGEQE